MAQSTNTIIALTTTTWQESLPPRIGAAEKMAMKALEGATQAKRAATPSASEGRGEDNAAEVCETEQQHPEQH